MAFKAGAKEFLSSQMDRLGVPEEERGGFIKNIYDWSRQVRQIESDDNPLASPENTTAKGVYQFVDPSVPVGKQRMLNMGVSADLVNKISDNPQKWTNPQADAIFLANIFGQDESDSYLKNIGAGDLQARQDAYYRYHHTAPDDATIKRVARLMPTLEDNVVHEQGSEAF